MSNLEQLNTGPKFKVTVINTFTNKRDVALLPLEVKGKRIYPAANDGALRNRAEARAYAAARNANNPDAQAKVEQIGKHYRSAQRELTFTIERKQRLSTGKWAEYAEWSKNIPTRAEARANVEAEKEIDRRYGNASKFKYRILEVEVNNDTASVQAE